MKKPYRNRIFRIAVMAAADFVAFWTAVFFSRLLLTGSFALRPDNLKWLAVLFVATAIFCVTAGLYSMPYRRAGAPEAVRILTVAFGMLLVGLLLCFTTKWIRPGMAVMQALLFFNALIALRFSYRFYMSMRAKILKYGHGEHAMIVGGGAAGFLAIREMQLSGDGKLVPICVIDDNPDLQHTRVSDVPVVGTRDDIPAMVQKYQVDRILVTMPAAAGKDMSEICNICFATGRRVQVLPPVYQVLESGRDAPIMSELRDVNVEDLLGRDPIRVNSEDVFGYIKGKRILVTGGGGSIGSELCRQIAAHAPSTLVIFDIYENNAYEIEIELRAKYPALDLRVLIGSVRDEARVRAVFEAQRPEIVFHAAAHKHVPLMETSPNEAVKNNVFGTLNVARAADEFGVRRFVMISTDKAVNPTNVMGATKRICEMIVQTFGRRSRHTEYVAVRFGNVLGSNGSVIPLFKKQIAAGGPVTVTHKDIIRYFMTIPEAVALVLQAGAYARGGEIFVLDMGKPVKIVTLAENLIRLSGFRPYVDIPIRFTGLRPGEKLYEEMLMKEEGLRSTANEMIHVGQPIPLDEDMLFSTLDELQRAMGDDANDLHALIARLVPTYVWQQAPECSPLL